MTMVVIWLLIAVSFFLSAIQFFSTGGLINIVIGVILFLGALLCGFGGYWALRGFNPDHTIIDDERIDHGKF